MKKQMTFLALVFLSCCNVTVTEENKEKDKEIGIKYTQQFYSLIKQKELAKAAKFFGGDVSFKQGLDLLVKLNIYLGDLDSVTCLDSKSKVQSADGKKVSQYVLHFDAFYKKGKAKEEIVLETIKDTLRVTGYHTEKIEP